VTVRSWRKIRIHFLRATRRWAQHQLRVRLRSYKLNRAKALKPGSGCPHSPEPGWLSQRVGTTADRSTRLGLHCSPVHPVQYINHCLCDSERLHDAKAKKDFAGGVRFCVGKPYSLIEGTTEARSPETKQKARFTQIYEREKS
jgi:hypothetical protein